MQSCKLEKILCGLLKLKLISTATPMCFVYSQMSSYAQLVYTDMPVNARCLLGVPTSSCEC